MTCHINNWCFFFVLCFVFIFVVFCLFFFLFCFVSVSSFFSGVISPFFSSSVLGTHRPGEFIFQCHIFLPFHIVHGVLRARILKWFAIPFSIGPHILSEISTMTHPSRVAPQGMAHAFIELVTAVVHIISLISFLWFLFSLYLPSER